MYQLKNNLTSQPNDSSARKDFFKKKELERQENILRVEQEIQMNTPLTTMDIQIKLTLEKLQRKRILNEKVERLLQKTKQKNKLDTLDESVKFNNKFFKDIRSLKTFVDANKNMKMMNIFNNVHTLKYLDYLRKNKDNILKDPTKDQTKLVDQKLDDKHQDDIWNYQLFPTKEQMEKEGYLTIDLTQDLQYQKQNSDSNMTYRQRKFDSQKLMLKSKSRLENLQINHPDNDEDIYIDKYIDENLLHQQMNNQPNQDCFYSIQNKKMVVKAPFAEPIQTNTKNNDKQQLNQRLAKELIKQLLNLYGVDVCSTQLQMKEVHQKYAENSAKMIKSIRQESMKLKTCPDQKASSPFIRRKFVNNNMKRVKSFDSKIQSPISELQKESQNLTPRPIFATNAQKKRLITQKTQFNESNQSLQMKNNINRFLTEIEETEKEFISDRYTDNEKMSELDNKIYMMQRKHEMYQLSDMGFNSYNSNIDRGQYMSQSQAVNSQKN